MTKVRVVYDRNMKAMAYIPHGVVLVDLGREAYDGIPIPLSPRRMRGDETKIEALFRNATEEARKEMLKQLRGISRKHATIHIWGDEAQLVDAGSRNGVFLKGVGIGGADKKLSPGEKFTLQNGTVFALGAWLLQFFDAPGDIEKLRKEGPGIYSVANAPPAKE